MTSTPLDWAPPPLRPYLDAAIATTQADPRLLGLIAVGSGATGLMDEFSDLDFVIVCRDEHQSDVVRDAASFAARIGPLISSFTGEHVREPRLLLCLYGPPLLRVDLKFVTESDLDRRIEDGRIVWQRDGALDAAFRRTAAVWPQLNPQWAEDRFWTWVYNGATKIGRGEFFACLEEIAFLRRTVIGPLIALRHGLNPNGVRRIEQIAPDVVPMLVPTIGDHSAAGCVKALSATVECYQRLRGDDPDLVRRTEAESSVLGYLAEIEARIARDHR